MARAPEVDREHVLDLVDELVKSFLSYDRKDDDDCPRGAIEALVASGDLTIDEIVERFQEALEDRLPEPGEEEGEKDDDDGEDDDNDDE